MSLTSGQAEQWLRDTLINRRVRIELPAQERRAIVGIFVCVDNEGNVVLKHASEVRMSTGIPPTDVSERQVPMTMVPGSWIASVKSADASKEQAFEEGSII